MPHLDRRELAAIFAGGAAGAVLRIAIARALPAAPGHWPWATFAANVAGAFVLGALVTRLQERLPLSSYRRPLLGTGFCGAFTTFSTVQVELLAMFDEHRYAMALAYAGATLAAGFAAVHVATALARRVRLVA